MYIMSDAFAQIVSDRSIPYKVYRNIFLKCKSKKTDKMFMNFYKIGFSFLSFLTSAMTSTFILFAAEAIMPAGGFWGLLNVYLAVLVLLILTFACLHLTFGKHLKLRTSVYASCASICTISVIATKVPLIYYSFQFFHQI